MKRKRENITGIPNSEMDSLARALLPVIQNLFENKETKQEFEEWQAKRKKEQLNTKTKNNEKKSH